MKYKIEYKSIGGADFVALAGLERLYPFNNDTLKDAVNAWCDDEEQARLNMVILMSWRCITSYFETII